MSGVSAAEKARLRREKMQKSSEARMAKILGAEPGRSPPALDSPVASDKRIASQAAATATQTRTLSASVADDDDPEEVDISTMPASTRDGFSNMADHQRMLQQMMMGGGGGDVPMGGVGQAGFGAGDPFAMLQQMMGGDQPMSQLPQQTPQEIASTRWWTILHMACVSVLALLIPASSVPVYGARSVVASMAPRGTGWFWYFVNLEILLQTVRFFVSGPQPTGGILATIGNFLPPPYQGYVWSLARYALIWTSLRDDLCLLLVGLFIRSIFL